MNLDEQENMIKNEKTKKHQNYEKTMTENLEIKTQKKLSNASLEDVKTFKINK